MYTIFLSIYINCWFREQAVRAQILKLLEPNFLVNRIVISSFLPKGILKSYCKAL